MVKRKLKITSKSELHTKIIITLIECEKNCDKQVNDKYMLTNEIFTRFPLNQIGQSQDCLMS